MSVCCECCVQSGRALCDEVITRPEESCRLWCVVMFDQENSWMRRPWPTGGLPCLKHSNNNKDSMTWYLLQRVSANKKFCTYTATIWILHLYRSHSRWRLRYLHFLGAQSCAAKPSKQWHLSTRLQGVTLYEAENLRVSVLFKQAHRLTSSPPVVGFGSLLTSSHT